MGFSCTCLIYGVGTGKVVTGVLCVRATGETHSEMRNGNKNVSGVYR